MTSASAAPIVDLITPTFNQASFLRQTIISVLSQDYRNIEYVVLDDGSTDNTQEILSDFKEDIGIVRHENIGQAQTLNIGWNIGSGKYLAYISSDDLLAPQCIREMVSVLENNSNIVCAFPNSDLIDEHGRLIKRNVCRPFSLVDLVVRQECYIGPGAVFRRNSFEKVGGWRTDLKLAPDREFWMRLANTGDFYFDERSLAKYRLHRTSIGYTEYSDEISREYLRVLDLYFSSDPLPECIARKDEAYGHANILLARNAFRRRQFRLGMGYYREACRLHPPLATYRTALSLTKSAIGKEARLIIGSAVNRFRKIIGQKS